MTSKSPAYLKLITWNACSISANLKVLELQHLLEKMSIDVACISETHLKPHQNLYIPNYKIIRSDRTHQKGGGVAIIIHNSIIFSTISTDISPAESVGIEIRRPSGAVRIVSVYVPNQNLHTCPLHTIFDSRTPTIVAGDFNAHHDSWNSNKINSNGQTLIDFALNNNIIIEAPSEPTYVPNDGNKTPSVLDIFITQNAYTPSDPLTLNELSSDHLPVFAEYAINPLRDPPSVEITDWVLLSYLLENSTFKCTSIDSVRGIDEAVDSLSSEITSTVKAASRPRAVSKAKLQLPVDVLTLIKEKNKTRRLWQRSRDSRLKPLLNSLQRQIHLRMREIRSASFEDFISEAESHPKSVWKVVKSLRNRKTQLPPLVHNGSKFSLDPEKANIFADSLRSQCSPLPSDPSFNDFHTQVRSTVQNFDTSTGGILPTSFKEVISIIRSFKRRKAPGSDNIHNSVLKILPRKHIVEICNIINAMLRFRYFPKAWKQADVILLPKPGKPLSSASSYRPISLLRSLSKIAEAVILKRLNDHVELSNLLPDYQHGFRSGHGAGHQLLRVSEYISDKLNKRWHTSMLLLDVKQAFDRVWHDGLKFKLISQNFPPYLVGVVSSFLSNRSIRVRVGSDYSRPESISAGVPQGSKLSPLLFNLFCADIPSSPNVITALYADDIALISSSNLICHSNSEIIKLLPELLSWYSKWRLSINETKSEAVFFSRRNRAPQNFIINNIPIKWSYSAKYLGVIFDRHLTWVRQINYVRNKAIGASIALKPFFTNPRVSLETKRRVFLACIKSICSYAIPIWGSAEPQRLARLQSTYMRLIRSALGIPWFIRNQQILKEFDLSSLHDVASELANNLRTSVLQHPNPTISVLGNSTPKDTDRYRRPCVLLQ